MIISGILYFFGNSDSYMIILRTFVQIFLVYAFLEMPYIYIFEIIWSFLEYAKIIHS